MIGGDLQRNASGVILDQQGNQAAVGTVVDLGAGGKFYVTADGKLSDRDPNAPAATRPVGNLVTLTGAGLGTGELSAFSRLAPSITGFKQDSTGRVFKDDGTLATAGTTLYSNWNSGEFRRYFVGEDGKVTKDTRPFYEQAMAGQISSAQPQVTQYVGQGILKPFNLGGRDINQVLSETLPPLYSAPGVRDKTVSLQAIDDEIFRRTIRSGYDPVAAGTKKTEYGNLGFGQAFAGGSAAIPNVKGAGLWAAGIDPNDPAARLRIERWSRENEWGGAQADLFYKTFGIDMSKLTNEERNRYKLEAVDWYFRTGGSMAPVEKGSDAYIQEQIKNINRTTGYVPVPKGTVINGVTLGGGLGARNDNPNTISAAYGGLIGFGIDPYDPALVQRLELLVRNDKKNNGEISGKLDQYFSKNPRQGHNIDIVNGVNWYYADLGRRMDKDNSFFGSLVGKIVGIGLTAVAGAVNPWLGAVVGAGIGAATGGITGAIFGGLGGYGWGNILSKVGINLNNIVQIPLVQKLGILPSPTTAGGMAAINTLLSSPIELGKKMAGGLAGVAWDELTEADKRQMTDLAIEMNVPISQFKAGMRQPGAATPAPSPAPAPAPSPSPASAPKTLADYAMASGLIKRAAGGEVTSPWASDLEQLTKGWDQKQQSLEDKFSQMTNDQFIQQADTSLSQAAPGEAKKDYTDLMSPTPNAMASAGINSFIKSYG